MIGASVAPLVAIALLPLWRRGVRGRVGGVWVIAVAIAALACHLLALGPAIHVRGMTMPGPFALMADVVPGWQLIRAPFRLSAPAVLGACALAGIGLAGMIDALPWRRALVDALVVGLAVLCVVTTVRRPLVIPTAETASMVPRVDRWLATAPRGPVVEIPFHPFRLVDRGRDVEARRMYRSIVHWQPLLGGYSGYTPPSYAAVSSLVQTLPDPRAAHLLTRTTGLRWIVLHRDELDHDARRAWTRGHSAYVVVARLGRDVVLRARASPPADLVEAFVADDRRATPLGTPRVPVPGDAFRGGLDFVTRPPALRLVPISLAVRVWNDGPTTWPALGATAKGLVTLAYSWHDAAGRMTARADAGRLPWDLATGEQVVARIIVEPPPRGARPVRLEIGLVQDDRWLGQPIMQCFDQSGVGRPCDG